MARSVLTRWIALAAVLAATPSIAAAQSLDAAAIGGVIIDHSGSPVFGANVRLLNVATGANWNATTDAKGRFLFDDLPPRGPYQVQVHAIGSEPVTTRPLPLRLGQRSELEIRLTSRAAVVPEMRVVASRPVDAGPAYHLPADAFRDLPLINRDPLALLRLVPQVVGRDVSSIDGQSPRFNALRIDGTASSDPFGLGLTPGSTAGGRAVPIEALAEAQVLTAPFDARYGGFSGGVLEAITRTGTNRFEATAFGALQTGGLTGREALGGAVPDLRQIQSGFVVAGPLSRDRLHFFLTAEIQRRDTTYQGPEADAPGTGITAATARRVAAAIENRFGVDPGGPEAPRLGQPNQSLFAKLTWRPTAVSHVDLSYSGLRATSDAFDRSVRTRNSANGWMLSGSGYRLTASVHAFRLRARTLIGRAHHELVVGYQTSDEERASRLRLPLFLVSGDVAGNYIGAGSFKNAQGTLLDQRQFQFENRLAVPVGRQHQLTVGVRWERLHFVDNLLLGRWGVWSFASADSLERGLPNRYEIGLPRDPLGRGPVADFSAGNVAGWLQDRWEVSTRLTLTAGLRVERPVAGGPATNRLLAASALLGHPDTGRFPSGYLDALPRLSATLLLDRRGRTVARAGWGTFSTRPPFVILSAAYTSTGQDQRLLICGAAAGIPTLTGDIDAQPTACPRFSVYGGGQALVTFAPGFRFPRVNKLVLGVDRDLGRDWSASVDLVGGWTRSALAVRDRNVRAVGTTVEGRTQYGTIGPGTNVEPARIDPGFGAVYQYQNTDGDRAVSATLVLSKRWGPLAYAQIGYQWSRVDERFAPPGNTAVTDYQNVPIEGTAETRRLARASFDVPHNFTAVIASPVPGGLVASVLLRAQSGRPYSYVVAGDANADSVAGNDLLHVPADSTDISLTDPSKWAALAEFIASQPCLARQRGRIMARGSCRNPGFLTLDARLARRLTIRGIGTVELSADVFNLPNLIDGDWGLVRETTGTGRVSLVSVTGWDQTANRPRYSVPVVAATGQVSLPARDVVISTLTRWRVQLGARYRP
ncbi:MAG: TonB-dependent receptor [Gemmatimonadales bacterium]|nr:TonB-dependent receptor [Gemmatimonadales bacterium]